MFEKSNATSLALVNFLRSCPSLSICSPSNLVLRVSNQVTMYENSDSPLSFNGFWLLNRKTWTVDVERAEMWCVKAEDVVNETRSRLRALKKKPMPSDELTPTKERLLHYQGPLGRVQTLISVFRQFQGCALTFKETDAPNSASEFNAFFGQPIEDPDFSIATGRPRKQEIALDSYQRVFPVGHGNHPWKIVVRKIEADCGLSIHVDTLKRALGKK
ncbi:hypothetical protein IV417_16130 [Alphaproteobacteria bacterium KMM 3653]|uniref:Uncharacterized protein n=1 Tax=Harenicola maris TaxID=2841044 RepID=A0AAP2G9E9_9RHOB|nr:hypothetical protein [Harenicola maris]